jgi:hypothetical protein
MGDHQSHGVMGRFSYIQGGTGRSGYIYGRTGRASLIHLGMGRTSYIHGGSVDQVIWYHMNSMTKTIHIHL